MKKFKRKGPAIVSHLSTYEVDLLSTLVSQLIEMVADGDPQSFPAEPSSDDPFEQWAKEFETDTTNPEPLEDPVLKRLFPNPYPHDADAALDFRRYTEHDLRTKKISDAQVVLNRLQGTEQGAYPVRIPREEADEWLRTLTSVRLAVATRLGITDAVAAEELSQLPDDDPRAFMMSVYDWLGFAQETLVSAL
ncbi:MAG TPA: DUF2017 domain-containing protein [Propionibacteriaceae bacterium]|nr:DUF2017 domain-containing protein [Propionibacteriaceae bacterium]